MNTEKLIGFCKTLQTYINNKEMIRKPVTKIYEMRSDLGDFPGLKTFAQFYFLKIQILTILKHVTMERIIQVQIVF